MLSSLLRPKKARRRLEESPMYSSPYAGHAAADFTEDDDEDEHTEEEEEEEEEGDDENDEAGQDAEDEITEGEEEGEDGDSHAPLLPIFSAAHLDALPVYNLTHAIRLIVLPRTETTLTWDQLRSPQVSQFLVKPMQQQIRTSHFNRATLYALMANCLQFQKESQANPGNAGNSKTRALVCELIAIKLLKEYNTRELIDALSYDFFPLQGLATPVILTPGQNGTQQRARPAAARISTLEVAIRASAKRFLAHPFVVQQLEAIWAGTIVFHSAADHLHRQRPSTPRLHQRIQPADSETPLIKVGTGYGTTQPPRSPDKSAQQHQEQAVPGRRTVTLYDPRDASLFKLSRLRVPRYRQCFSTGSLFILLCLFVAVLAQRSTDITTLEVVFWFWSAGFMLDEVVGFNEQGFGLYIMSFWNAFDLGILFLLSIYYCMRLYGVLLVGVGRDQWNSMAYDVLATNAILLFPRLFSVLDHYRYFSQLLIAFRLMAIDLVAVFVLILIACSGFFVAFTLSFGDAEYDAAGVAYKIFQILMGFTPAAWEAWPTYNPLGKALLVLFLFICHFLVVTILITVLTNSFMAIVSNADQEHQFVFAVNTISMVKNDALFSYVAPSNTFAWILTPLRYALPFRSFIKLNRTVIKATHFPLLFTIYAYEKIFLARSVFHPTDLVEHRGRKRLVSFQDAKMALFSPGVRMRQESVAGYQKDSALDDVFRLAPRPDALRSTRKSLERRQTHNVVNNWMDQGSNASPPQEQDRSIVDRLEMRRRARKATLLRHRGISGTRSVASDPAEFMSSRGFHDVDPERSDADDDDHESDEDGDDELATHDDNELERQTTRSRSRVATSYPAENIRGDFSTSTAAKPLGPKLSSSASSKKRLLAPPKVSPPQQRRAHDRTLSSGTILFNPISESSASPPKSRPLTAKYRSNTNTGTHTPTGHQTPKPSIYTLPAKSKPRPIFPNRQNFQSVPSFNLDSQLDGNALRARQIRHRRSSLDMGMSDLGLEQNAPGALGAVPNSFETQMALATGGLKGFGRGKSDSREGDTERMMGRLMLARMKTLEEGFADVVREFRGMRTAGNSSVENELLDSRRDRGRGKEKENQRPKQKRKALPRTTSEVDFASMDRGRSVEAKALGQDVGAATPEGAVLQRYMSKGSSL
ncbi:integral membrane channel protein [Diplocarpon rosae]|nr:integral membrane channel protein [Diplocarpon rosae]